MAMFACTYFTSPDGFTVAGAKAGNPSEMEAALLALITARSGVVEDTINDLKLAGVEQGPEWEAALVFGDPGGGGATVNGSLAMIAAAVGASPAEAYSNLADRLSELHSGTPSLTNVYKVAIAAGGRGDKFMAVALCSQSVG